MGEGRAAGLVFEKAFILKQGAAFRKGLQRDQVLIKTKHGSPHHGPGPPRTGRFCGDRGVGRPGPQAPLPASLPALAAPPARPGSVGQRAAVKNDHGLPCREPDVSPGQDREDGGRTTGRLHSLGGRGRGLDGCLLPGPPLRAWGDLRAVSTLTPRRPETPELEAGWDVEGRGGCRHVSNLRDVVSETS